MILAIDVGNTNIVFGGYKDKNLIFLARMATELKHEAEQYAVEIQGILKLYGISGKELRGVIVSSVVPMLTKVIFKAMRHFTDIEPYLLTINDAGNMKILIDNPEELGTDLLASALELYKTFPMPAVILDMGTATKLIAMDIDGNLQGVSIMPGLFVSLKALVQSTSTLNSVYLTPPKNAIGKNTTESLKSGMVLANACAIDGMIDLFAQELGAPPAIIATGGASAYIVPHCKHKIQRRPSLVLDGLLKAYLNLEQKGIL